METAPLKSFATWARKALIDEVDRPCQGRAGTRVTGAGRAAEGRCRPREGR